MTLHSSSTCECVDDIDRVTVHIKRTGVFYLSKDVMTLLRDATRRVQTARRKYARQFLAVHTDVSFSLITNYCTHSERPMRSTRYRSSLERARMCTSSGIWLMHQLDCCRSSRHEHRHGNGFCRHGTLSTPHVSDHYYYSSLAVFTPRYRDRFSSKSSSGRMKALYRVVSFVRLGFSLIIHLGHARNRNDVHMTLCKTERLTICFPNSIIGFLVSCLTFSLLRK